MSPGKSLKDAEVTTLEQRLQNAEDRLEIYQIVCGYGYSVDGLNPTAVGTLYAEDGIYAVGHEGRFEGRAAVQAITQSPGHLDLVRQGVAHISTLPYVVITGDNAVATCHTMVAKNGDDGFAIWRLSASRIELRRNPEAGWEIVHRQNYMLQGDPAGSQLLGRLMEPPKAS